MKHTQLNLANLRELDYGVVDAAFQKELDLGNPFPIP